MDADNGMRNLGQTQVTILVVIILNNSSCQSISIWAGTLKPQFLHNNTDPGDKIYAVEYIIKKTNPELRALASFLMVSKLLTFAKERDIIIITVDSRQHCSLL